MRYNVSVRLSVSWALSICYWSPVNIRPSGDGLLSSPLPAIRRQFASLQMEVQPLSEAEYAELKTLGLDGVMVYQESYHEAIYAHHHLKGKKQDFFWRLERRTGWAAQGSTKSVLAR